MIKKKELAVKKPNQTIMISNGEITATQRKAYNVLLQKAQQDLKINKNQMTFLISIAEIEEKAGIQDTNNKRLKEDLTALMDVKIECIHEKNNWVKFVLLSQVRKEGDLLQFAFPPVIVEALLKGDYYTTLDLMILKTLKGKYAIIFYELAMRYHKVEIPKLDIDEFKALTGTENYRDFSNLRQMVIDPGLEEVNRESDIIMNYETFTAGRKVVAIKFGVKQKPQMVLEPTPSHELSPSEQSIKIDKETIKSLTVPGTAPELVRQTIEECGIEAVTEIYNAFLDKLKKAQNGKGKKIEDPAAYYANNLRKRIGAKTPEQRQAEKEKKLAAEKQRQKKVLEAIRAEQELQAIKAENKRLEGLVAALSESDREKLRAVAIQKIPPSMIRIKTAVKNRMESLVEDFIAGKLN
jgi:hypothetical protein